MKAALAIAFVLLTFGSANAATPVELYQQGKYDAAIAAGTAQNNAQGFAVAARSELAQEMMREKPCLICLRRAQDDARKAIAADPNYPDGHILLAGALGYEARYVGKMIATTRGLASQAKEQLDVALALDPQSAWALAALGGWNIEVVRGGGAPLARWMYGANVEDGLDDFKKAFALAPNSLVLRFQYALSLAGYDADTYRSEIDDALTRTETLKPQSAYEVFAQNCTGQLHQLLKHGDMPRFQELVHRYQQYP